MRFSNINNLYDQIIESLSFIKICPNCKMRFKDTLDKMIICKECEREQKINQILTS